MYFDNLYNELLIQPLVKHPDLNKLLVVAGYATSAMSFRHLNELRERFKNIKVQLILGMTSKDGLTTGNHNGLKKLVQNDFHDSFQCSYILNSPPVHSKVYIWCQNNKPISAFTGSANYTQTAFCLKSQRESMTDCNPIESFDYFKSLQEDTIYCDHPDAEQFITIYRSTFGRKEFQTGLEKETENINNDYQGLPSVTESLLDNQDNLPAISGLNWGHRLKLKRNKNQAYIRISSKIYKTKFFPPISVHFTILTDDGKSLNCSRSQKNGKAISTHSNNSLMGEYFRNRLGLPYGELVLKEHLIKYGRTDVTFYKIDDETYYMDFAP